MGSLSANREVAAMTESAIGADFDEPLDVHRNFLAQIAFDQAFGLDDRTNVVDLFFAEILNLLHRVNLGFIENTRSSRMPDPVDVGQRYVDMFLAGKIHACNTCHCFLNLSRLPALSFWLLAEGQELKGQKQLSPGAVYVSSSRRSRAPRLCGG